MIKKIAIIIAILAILSLYIGTIVLGAIGSELFNVFLYLSFAVPFFLYVIIWFRKVLKK